MLCQLSCASKKKSDGVRLHADIVRSRKTYASGHEGGPVVLSGFAII